MKLIGRPSLLRSTLVAFLASSLVATGWIGLAGPAAADNSTTSSTFSITHGGLISEGSRDGVAPCWAFYITNPPAGTNDIRVDIYSNGQLTRSNGLYSGTTDHGQLYCVGPDSGWYDDPEVVASAFDRNGQPLGKTAPLHPDWKDPDLAKTTAAALATTMQLLVAQGIDHQVMCEKAGEALPSHEIFDSSVPDVQLACDATTSTEQLQKLLQLVLNSSAVAIAGNLAWFMVNKNQPCWQHVCTTPTPSPTTDADPDLSTPEPDPALEVTERDLVIERIRELKPQLSVDEVAAATDTCLATQQKLLSLDNYHGSDNPCMTDALFFPGRNAGGAAIHDRDAILKKPHLAMLTYRDKEDPESALKNGKGQKIPEKWYTRQKWTDGNVTCVKMPKGDGKDCDEYPFWSSMEGGPGASLRMVPESENRSEGASLEAMQGNPDCEMATTSSGTKNTRFLVLPVAIELGNTGTYGGPLSFHVCGNKKQMPTPAGMIFN